jgi:hypothetical protein
MATAFIPAKGTSTAILQKNLQLVGGKSLVRRTLEFALNSHFIKSVVVSTDSSKVVEECSHDLEFVKIFNLVEAGTTFAVDARLFIHRRLDSHATSSSKTVDGILNFLENSNHAIHNEDKILLLQPTSPFRESYELEEIINLYESGSKDSVVSAKKFDSPHPDKAISITKNNFIKIEDSSLNKLSTPRQELRQLFVFDGAYYLVNKERLIKNKLLVSNKTQIYLREGLKTINIDNQEDLDFANYIASNNPS